ncbi:Do family serine endopeptidase [Allosphingosinicella sp.]|uniref:Do family serine endopeptidase n=1 Tax=Allosphingosinicella sp. TaxID=2823234 RepID=UPI002F005DE9
MRYVYGITAALLLGGTVATLSNPVGAQVAQNEPGAINAAVPRAGAPMSFADLVERLQPAVVNISTQQVIQMPRNRSLPPGFEEFFRRFGSDVPQGGDTVTQRGGSLGSGFIISADGYVVTNNHVVAPARDNAVVEAITVTLHDGTEYEAEVVGRDNVSDLAVLRIRPRGALPFVRFGDSRQVRVGDWVIAIGNPFTLGGTVTAGIVSALHRNLPGGGVYDRFIQTDAPINSGNSGGPMFDLQGNVIGINTALVSPTGGNVGIGFAIPAEQARPIVEALRRGERVRRGYIGVGLQELNAGVAAALGIERNRGELIRSVAPGGPAARAGVQEGDVVISVNGQPVTPQQTLSYLVSTLPIGSRVPLEIIRDGRRSTVTVVLAERPSEEELARLNQTEDSPPTSATPKDEPQSSGQRSAREGLGLTVQTLTPDVARQLGIADRTVRGVVVSAVDQSSDAAVEGIEPGDIILSIDRRPTRTPEEAAAAIGAARRANRPAVLLQVRRGNNPPAYVGVDLVRGR